MTSKEDGSQLVVYHAMFNPDTAGPNTTWTHDAPCQSCSFWMDNFNGVTVHLNHRDITIVAASRAPYPTIAAYRKRMGWTFPWLSSAGSDFNFDYGVSFTAEQLTSGEVEYNYIDMLNVAYHYMDLVPKGRDEGGNTQFWVRRRDEYQG